MSRTLLIGLDGATFRILDPLIADGVMPFLGKFVGGGVRAPLLSTTNPVTPPAWTTVMTGRSPGQHGVFDFVRAEERDEEVYFTLYDARDIGCETIWSMASRHGKRIVSLNFPMMFPHPDVSGYIIPGLTSWRHLKLGTRPPELHDRLKALHIDPREMAWDFELGKKVVYGISPAEYESWVRFHIRREHHWFAIARDLMERDLCDLTGVLWDGPDKLFHICWRFVDPAWLPANLSPWEREIRRLCLEYFRCLDGYIRELVSLAGPDAHTVIVSDHGFGPTTQELFLNTWLHEQGHLTWREPRSEEEAASPSWKRRLKSNFVLLDWQHTKAYARTSSSNGIYIRRASERVDGGVPDGEYDAFRDELTRALYAIRDPLTGEAIVQRVWTREEAFPGPFCHQAPDLTLVLNDHGFISIRNRAPALQARPEVTGTHYPDGIFLARGPRIRCGATLGALSILDVAPVVLHTLGLRVPADLEGSVPVDIFEERPQLATLRAAAVSERPDYVSVAAAPAAGDDPAGEAAVLDRLRTLGYLD